MATDGSLLFDTGVDNSGFEKGLKSLAGLSAKAAAGITAAFTAAASAAVKVGSSFTASMSQVSATMGITRMSAEYETLSAAAEEMGAATKFSATQAGDALNYLALAGYDANKAVSALPTVLNTAAAGGLDLAYASDLITDSMSALGLGMDELESFSDKLAKTSQKSNTNIAQLGEAILTVGGTAKTLSGGVTELNTMLGLIADNGIKGAEGGTALRNIILSLSAPTDTAAEAMKRLNVSAFDSQGNLRDLSEVFADFNAALAPLTDQQKTQALNEIFNKVDLKAVNALLGTSAERFDELEDYIENCEGAAAEMAKTMDDNLTGDLTIMSSALEGLGIAAFDKFEDPMRSAVQAVTEDISQLTAEIKNGALSEQFDKISDAAGRLITAVGEFAANDLLPTLINGMALIIEHGKSIATIIALIGANVAAVKISKAISAADEALTILRVRLGTSAATAAFLKGELTTTQAVVGLFTGKVSAATVATTAFQTAIKALTTSPFLVATIAIGVVTAVARYTNSLSEATEITKDAQEAVENYNKALEQQNEQIEKNNGNLESDKTMLNDKIAIYEKLRKQYEQTGEGEQELIDITKEIQELSPTTIQFIDDETQQYISLADAIDDVVAAMERKYKRGNAESDWEFAQDELTELYKQRDELSKDRAELEKDFQNKYGISSDKSDFKNVFMAYGVVDVVAMGYAKKRINDNDKAMQDINAAIADAESRSAVAMKDITDTYLNSTDESLTSFYMTDADNRRLAGQEYAKTIEAENTKMLEKLEKDTKKLEDGFEKLDHEYNTGIIKTTEELYEKKKALLDKYGTETCEDQWKFYEEIYGYEKDFAEKSAKTQKERQENVSTFMSAAGKLISEGVEKEHTQTKESLEKTLKTVKNNLSNIVSSYKTAMSDITSNIASYKNKLLSVGDIFSIEETEKNGKKVKAYTINNLEEQMSAMKKYHSYVKNLKESGASQGLLEELTSLDFEDGAVFGKYLSGLSDAEFSKINDYYNERDALADELSKDLYEGEAEKLNSILQSCVNDALEALPPAAQTAGKKMLAGIMDGMTGNEDLTERMNVFMDGFSEVYDKALEEIDLGKGFSAVIGGINAYAEGQNLAKQLMNGFDDEMKKYRSEISVSQTAAAAGLASGGAAQAAQTTPDSGKKSDKISVDTTNNITVQIDGETVSRTTEKHRTQKERRTG
ncbi:MAG: phage tail tape measure protein [Oscillospiraceae bacterium]|nr:phage tail tape measure protein [Oscillospiraceae bacterium]MDD7279090.1 phage tail tape measure protein [Oscillospiraceae bacterium]MDY2863166.1 phage tail tape measure protein [Oscillospiraceae bacterium]